MDNFYDTLLSKFNGILLVIFQVMVKELLVYFLVDTTSITTSKTHQLNRQQTQMKTKIMTRHLLSVQVVNNLKIEHWHIVTFHM